GVGRNELEPIAGPLFRIGMCDDIGDNGDAVCPRCEDSGCAFERDAADRHERALGERLPFADPSKALRRPGHYFELRFIDRPKRQLIGVSGKRPARLSGAVGRDAELEPGPADRGHIRSFKIALAKMDEPRAAIDGLLPIIVHDEFAAIAPANVKRAPDSLWD